MNFNKNEEILMVREFKLLNYLPHIGIKQVQEEIYNGLKSFPKYISPKFFYDERGSELFEKITKLDEYYPTRTEKSILSTIVKDLDLDFSELSIIELGSGDHSKISLLLQQIAEDDLSTIKYFPVDISHSAIEKSSKKLANEFPMINITGIVADFMHQLNTIPREGKRLFLFLGSTIGNLNDNEKGIFLKLLGSEMKNGDSLLLGIDMVKDSLFLERAYNDDKQITADFNRNILIVTNKLAVTNFEPSCFDHLAFYNTSKKRIEMHLKARKDMIVNFSSGFNQIQIKKDETIHTENSCKFDREDISKMSLLAGLGVENIFTDSRKWFSLAHYKKSGRVF